MRSNCHVFNINTSFFCIPRYLKEYRFDVSKLEPLVAKVGYVLAFFLWGFINGINSVLVVCA